ncbi:hypothetical protein B0H14DRAFT_2549412 [Mycena olivaceomarginata]|nr:hypothetical protein B0H14DRAFT_2549412 [Mycena olivaceomarginata]
MLLLYLFVHLLQSKNGSAAPVLSSPEPRALTDACDDINNCRKLFDIVWGCLATIFACTWVSVHPNVPPPRQSWLALLWRRLKMMLIAVLAPELVVGFAARQLLTARNLSKEYEISTTHGFFVSMGGFVDSSGCPVTTRKQLDDPEFLAGIQSIDAKDIMDRSKGDALSKGLALAQGLWFSVQYFARIHQHFPVTQLEVATLAFAVVNVFTWALWWGKPLDVQRPIVVGPPKAEAANITRSRGLLVQTRFFGVIAGGYNFDEEKYDPLSSSSVPSFWALDSHEGAAEFRLGFIFQCLVGVVFGAIHCAAWNTGFPTAQEMWIWRSCSLSVTTIPILTLASSWLIYIDFLALLGGDTATFAPAHLRPRLYSSSSPRIYDVAEFAISCVHGH